MITFTEKEKRKGTIPDLAKDIIVYISDKPYLYLPMSMVVSRCYDKTESRIKTLFETAKFEPDLRNHLEEVEHFKGLLIQYYTIDNTKWSVADRRGLLLEELMASISPLKFNFNYRGNVSMYREARIVIDSNPISNMDIDVVFCDKDFLINGIECKVTVANFLVDKRGKKLRKVARKKLTYFTKLLKACKKCNSTFFPWFCTMQKNVSYEKKLLQDNGFADVDIITGDTIGRILNAS